MHEYHTVHTQMHLPQSDRQALALDIQMKLVADQEDAYWLIQFTNEPYYIAGRGYDQYQPAYALGCRAALEYPDARFRDLVLDLEMQWGAQRTTSLLPWREVHDAVKRAWEHANLQMQQMQQSNALRVVHGAAIATVLQPLCKSCRSLHDELLHMRTVPMNDFARQVLDRHVHLLRSLMQELESCFRTESLKSPGAKQSIWGLRAHWRKVRASLSEQRPAEIFEFAENREQLLLDMYRQALDQELPGDVKNLLQQHQKIVQKECAKLVWVRQNWYLQ